MSRAPRPNGKEPRCSSAAGFFLYKPPPCGSIMFATLRRSDGASRKQRRLAGDFQAGASVAFDDDKYLEPGPYAAEQLLRLPHVMKRWALALVATLVIGLTFWFGGGRLVLNDDPHPVFRCPLEAGPPC